MLLEWEEESYPSLKDYYQVLFFSIALPVARFALNCLLFEVLGKSILFGWKAKYGKDKQLQESREKVLAKFTESCWKLVYYLSLEVYAVSITLPEPWFGNTAAFWDGWPDQMLKLKLKLYYTAQCGFYIYSVAALLFWETRRKDFAVMMTHHVITVGLIAYSYITGSFRVGSIVLALHDISDIFMEGAKLFKYSGNEAGASILFGLFALSWLVLRLYIYPFYLIWSTSVECLRYIDTKDPRVPWEYYQFNTLLITLLVIHVYWWVLICRMIVRQLQNAGKVGDDVRSDSDDDA